jgi:hypothetical protein
MALTSKLAVVASAALVSTQDLGEARASMAKTYSVDLADGTTAGKADRVFHDTRTLAASANEDLDLAGVLTDPLGQTLTFARIKALIVAAAAGNVNNVVVGGAPSNAWVGPFGAATHTNPVRPGQTVAYVCGSADATGWAVTAGTGDLLRIANSGAGTTVTYDIIVIGTSA